MLWKSTNENNSYVSDHIKYQYLERLKDILVSNDEKSKSHSYIVQIIQTLYNDCDRYNIFWECWKRCAMNIIDQNIYLKIIAFFINDLEYVDSNCKKKQQGKNFSNLGVQTIIAYLPEQMIFINY